MEYLIKTYTNEGDTVLDFTMGSGTTGVACKNLNRKFIGIELAPEYFKIAEKRINGYGVLIVIDEKQIISRSRRFISSSPWKKKYPLRICRRL